MPLCHYISQHFFLLFQHCILLRSTGQSGSEETALVIIHLSIFSHVLLHYSHPSIYTAIRVCHSNELQLASPVITTAAVLPFLTAVSCHAKLTLITGKVSFKCQWVPNHPRPSCPHGFFFAYQRMKEERGQNSEASPGCQQLNAHNFLTIKREQTFTKLAPLMFHFL